MNAKDETCLEHLDTKQGTKKIVSHKKKCPTPGCDSSGNTNPSRKFHLSQNYCPLLAPSQKNTQKNDLDKENENNLSNLLNKGNSSFLYGYQSS